MRSRYEKMLIGVIILFALALRLYGLNGESIWIDESLTAYYTFQPIERLFDGIEKTPPAYHILERWWCGLFGITPFALRILSVIFGTASAYAIYLLGKDFGGQRSGLISAFILAISPYHIFLSQEARSYSLYILLSIISMHCFIMAYRDRKYLPCYIISSILLTYTHYFGALVIVCQMAYSIFSQKMKSHLRAYLMIIIASMPLILLIQRSLKDESGSFWIGNDSMWMVRYLPKEFSGGLILSILFGILLLYALTRMKREGAVLYIWLSLPVLLAFSISFLFPVFQIKYVAASMIPLIVLVSYSISRMGRAGAIALAFVAVLSLYAVVGQVNTMEKEPWEDIHEKISLWEPDALMIDPGYYITAYEYYNRECFREYPIIECAEKNNIYTVWRPSPLIFNLHRFETFAYIISSERSHNEGYVEFLKEQYKVAEEVHYETNRGFDVISVYLFESRS